MSDVVISVRGEHEERLTPERGTVRLTVHSEGPERPAVTHDLAVQADPIRRDLERRAESGGLEDWHTDGVTTWSERPWNGDGPRLAPVHHASATFRATFSDFEALADWAGAVAAVESAHLDGIEWTLTPETEQERRAFACAQAVRAAVARATAYAQALGIASVVPLEVADPGLLTGHADTAGEPPRMMRASFAADSARDPGIAVKPEEIIVSAAVEARFGAR